MTTGQLEGKSCIVTGAAGSLGLASAEHLLRESAKVMMIDRDGDALRDAAQRLAAYGERVVSHAADVADAAATAGYVGAAAAQSVIMALVLIIMLGFYLLILRRRGERV